MNLEDLNVILTQNLGINAEIKDDFILSYWKISPEMEKKILFYIDQETGLLYVSLRLETSASGPEHYKQLLWENLKLSLVKFCLDKEGNIIILSEIPLELFSEGILKRAVFGIFKVLLQSDSEVIPLGKVPQAPAPA